ncbi:MAG: hypothetical protein ACXVZJ_12560 [Terriglobales bacterium]
MPSRKVVGWVALGKLAIAEQISIERGPSQNDALLLEVDGFKRPDIDPSVRGVLGENFLSRIDFLIDNRHRQTWGTVLPAQSKVSISPWRLPRMSVK